jgi:NTE family protein
MAKVKKVGLALGSGALRGFALIGAIRALNANNIPINYISGASIGSFIGAYYALFEDLDSLEKEVIDNPRSVLPSVFDMGLRGGGLVNGRRFEAFVERVLGRHDFSEAKIPIQIVATDLNGGQPYIFSEGKIAKAVRASCSVPVIFEPTKIKGHRLVDGGLSDPVPVDILKKAGADIVIAINLYHKNEFIDKRFTFTKVALRSTRIALYHLAQASIKNADIVIAPDVSKFTQTNKFKRYFKKEIASQMINIGFKETSKYIDEIKELLK